MRARLILSQILSPASARICQDIHSHHHHLYASALLVRTKTHIKGKDKLPITEYIDYVCVCGTEAKNQIT